MMIELLVAVRNVTIGGCSLLVGSVPEYLFLLGDRLADAVDAADVAEGQVGVGRVGEPRGVRGVG